MARLACLVAALALSLTLALGAAAQPVTAPDYSQFDRVASNAEQTLQRSDIAEPALEKLRDRLADWREALLRAQSINSARIDSVRSQLDALGPPPDEGESEPEATARQREDLNETLEKLLVPRRRAESAYGRADALIGEIDAMLRQRQAEQLLQVGPSPLNPVHWVRTLGALAETGRSAVTEAIDGWRGIEDRDFARRDLPVALASLLVAAFLLVRGRYRTEQLTDYLWRRSTGQGRDIIWFLLSLGQIGLPFLGILIFVSGVGQLSILGERGTALLDALPLVVLSLFSGAWLGSHVFPREPDEDTPLLLPGTAQAQGRLFSTLLGLLFGLDLLARRIGDFAIYDEPENAVLAFPMLLLSSLVLLRFGQFLLQDSAARNAEGDSDLSFRAQVTALFGRAVQIIGALGPALAAVGYLNLARFIVYPTVLSLALIGLLAVLFPLVRDTYALLRRSSIEEADNALVPVLINLGLTLCSLPVFALIWGARRTDVLEIWAQFRTGFAIGDTRISPSDFFLFALVFTLGLIVTRLLQGTLRSTVLPRTKLDTGGRNAVVAGLGYVGIFLAGLLAVTAAGIDLSSLAIVAGALSVGIGFGLQTIVSNFVSGIILLIERPISQGDWIEVGGRMGIVKDISVRSTRIETFDRTDVIVPNADFVSGTVTNWTRGNLFGRATLKLRVGLYSDSRAVERILVETCESHPLVAIDPPPAVYFLAFGENALEFTCHVYLRDVNYILVVQSELNHMFHERLREEGIEIPLPQRDLWLRNPGSLHDPAASGTGDREERADGARHAGRAQPPVRDHEGIDDAQGDDV